MKVFWADIWTGLRTGPARALLALVSLALGLFAMTILLATLDALQRQADRLVQAFGAGAIVLRPEAGQAPWGRTMVEYFRANLGADAAVSGVRTLPPPAGADFAVAAGDDQLARARGWRIVAGRALDGWDLRHAARVALAPAGLCQRKNWREGDLVLLGHEPFRLVGCYEAGGEPVPGFAPDTVFIPATVAALGADPRDERGDISALLLSAAGTTAPEELQRRARGLLCGFGLDDDAVEWITPDTLLRGVRRWQRAVGWVAGSSAALGLLLGAVSLAGMLLTGVRERVAEIGLRRALGARPHEIALLFVAEAAVLGLGAALLGLLGAGAVLLGQGARFPLPFHFGVGAWLIPLVLAGGIVILCSLGPAWQAARLPPAEALRNE